MNVEIGSANAGLKRYILDNKVLMSKSGPAKILLFLNNINFLKNYLLNRNFITSLQSQLEMVI